MDELKALALSDELAAFRDPKAWACFAAVLAASLVGTLLLTAWDRRCPGCRTWRAGRLEPGPAVSGGRYRCAACGFEWRPTRLHRVR